MDVVEIARAAWNRRLMILGIVGGMLAVTGVVVAIQKPVYQAHSTIQLSSRDSSFLSQVNAIVPTYSQLITSSRTAHRAAQLAGAGADPATISAQTNPDAAVLRIEARSSRPELAQRSCEAVVTAVDEQVTGGLGGYPGIAVQEISGPTMDGRVWPRPALSLGVAALVGLGLAVPLAGLAEKRNRAGIPTPAVGPTAQTEGQSGAAPAPATEPGDEDPNSLFRRVLEAYNAYTAAVERRTQRPRQPEPEATADSRREEPETEADAQVSHPDSWEGLPELAPSQGPAPAAVVRDRLARLGVGNDLFRRRGPGAAYNDAYRSIDDLRMLRSLVASDRAPGSSPRVGPSPRFRNMISRRTEAIAATLRGLTRRLRRSRSPAAAVVAGAESGPTAAEAAEYQAVVLGQVSRLYTPR